VMAIPTLVGAAVAANLIRARPLASDGRAVRGR